MTSAAGEDWGRPRRAYRLGERWKLGGREEGGTTEWYGEGGTGPDGCGADDDGGGAAASASSLIVLLLAASPNILSCSLMASSSESKA